MLTAGHNIYSILEGYDYAYEVTGHTVSLRRFFNIFGDPWDGIGDAWCSHRYKHVAWNYRGVESREIHQYDLIVWDTGHTYRWYDGGQWYYPWNHPIAQVQDMTHDHLHYEELSYDDYDPEVSDGYYYVKPVFCLNPFYDGLSPIIDSKGLYPQGKSVPVDDGQGTILDPYVVTCNLDVRIKGRDVSPGQNRNVNVWALAYNLYDEYGVEVGGYYHDIVFSTLKTETDEGTHVVTDGVGWIYDTSVSDQSNYYYWITNSFTSAQHGYSDSLDIDGLDSGTKYRIQMIAADCQEYVAGDSYPLKYNSTSDDIWFIKGEGPVAPMKYFLPVIRSGGVEIVWETEREIGTDYFQVERLVNEMPDEFMPIGDRVSAKGDIDHGATYTFIDPDGSIQDAYRLVEVDDTGRRGPQFHTRVRPAMPARPSTASRGGSLREKPIDTNRYKPRMTEKPYVSSPAIINYEWVAIYPDSFSDQMAPLIEYRDSVAWMHGKAVHGITTEQIAQTYGDIKSYINYLWNNQNKCLKYVFLVGDASSYAYCDTCSETTHDIIPIDRYEDGFNGTPYFSDIAYADPDNDGYAEIAVGRLPAYTKADVGLYVYKLLYYEQHDPGDWEDDVTFLVFDKDWRYCTGEFAGRLSTDLADYIPQDYDLHYISAEDTFTGTFPTDYDELETIAINEFDSGRSMILAFGSAAYLNNLAHWLVTAWHIDDPFRIWKLNPNNICPFVIGASCDVGNFTCDWIDDDDPTITEELLFYPDRGALAMFTPTGATWQSGNYELCELLLQYLYDWGAPSLGHACMAAQKRVMLRNRFTGPTARMFVLLGDPAIRLAGSVIDDPEILPYCTASFTYPSSINDFLFTCPAGDAETLMVNLTFEFDFMPHDIAANEITLDSIPPDTSFILFNGDPITTDSAATAGNNYTTTITHSNVGGCGCGQLNVRVNGYSVGTILLAVRSPDYTGDGKVNISDFSFFGDTYNKSYGEEGYDDCFDYNSDHKVDLSDYGYFGDHYHHEYSGGGQQNMLADAVALSNTSIKLTFEEKETERGRGTIAVAVDVERPEDICHMCLGLTTNSEHMEYAGWKSNGEFPHLVLVSPAVSRGRNVLFLSSSGNEPLAGERCRMGTLYYTVREGAELDGAVEDFTLVYGDILDSKGQSMKIRGVEETAGIPDDAPPVYKNYLSGNYPNPFNPTTIIEYGIEHDSHVNLSIYNVAGQRIRVLVDEVQRRNNYSVVWDGADCDGNAVASGVYFYRLKMDGFTKSRKLVILR